MSVCSCTLKYQGGTGPPEATCAMHKNWPTTLGHILRMRNCGSARYQEKRRKKAEEEKAEKVMLQRALSVSLLVLCISSRVLCPVLRVLCLCASLSKQARLAPT